MYGSYLYDYTIRCFMYMVGKDIPKGIYFNNVIRNIDILPTILDTLKIKPKENYKKIIGKSFLPFFKGRIDERHAYSETGGLGGPTPSPEKHNVKSIRTNRWKLIYNETNNKKELYDLDSDKEEKINLIGKFPDIEAKLSEEMDKYSTWE